MFRIGGKIPESTAAFATEVRAALKQAWWGIPGCGLKLFLQCLAQQRGSVGSSGARHRIYPGEQLIGNLQRNRCHI